MSDALGLIIASRKMLHTGELLVGWWKITLPVSSVAAALIQKVVSEADAGYGLRRSLNDLWCIKPILLLGSVAPN